MYMLLESCMRLLMYIFCIYKKHTSSTFWIFALATVPTTAPFSVLFRNYVKFQDQSFHIKKVCKEICIIDLFSINLIYINFNICDIFLSVFL